MKLHILSDVHLEFGKWPRNVDVNAIDADVTILAGDIGVGLEGIQWALTINRPVIYVFGNHEFYGLRPMNDLWRTAKSTVAGTHIHLLENEELVLNGVRFLGCTLWTDFCILGADRQKFAMNFASNEMSDYANISATPHDTLSLHQESREFLGCRLADAFNGTTVVITHHAPSALSLTDRKVTSETDATCATNLDALVAKANLWVHGHTHIPVDYLCFGPGICPGPGRVISNPRGYAELGEMLDFKSGLVVEV
ncbi:MAG: phosphoesterase [Rhodocyclaceae bacterium]|nr:phosphoesterase [Rhodocyclaceae bacterium]